jgi:hypothetical protein
VLVVDSQADRVEENAAILDELRKGLADYARSFDDLPLVVQYNKRDLSDDYVIDELHRRLELGNATVFESVAVEGTGVLQALSTISKKVIRSLRGQSLQAESPVDASKPASVAEVTSPDVAGFDSEPADDLLEDSPMLAGDALEPVEGVGRGPALEVSSQDLEEAILSEGEDLDEGATQLVADVQQAQNLLDPPWHHRADSLEPPLGARIGRELTIVSVGEATRADERSVRVPLVLGDGQGETSTLVLTVRLDPLLDESD